MPREARARNEPEVESPHPYDIVGIVNRFESPLLRYVIQILGRLPAADPEDIVQETFLRLHRTVQSNGHGTIVNLKAWLFRVAHNQVMDAGRKQERERRATEKSGPGASDGPSDDPIDALAELVRKEACERAMTELQHLPPEEKQVILLKIVHGMKLREIGEVTGLTPGNIDYRIRKGLKTLAERLKGKGVM